MLSMIETTPEVFELKQVIHSYNEDIINYWYWDLNRNIMSEKPDFPQPSMYTRELRSEDIARFERFYRPLLKPAV